MRRRHLSLALALLLLVTQQWAVLHGLSHGLRQAGGAVVASAIGPAEPVQPDARDAADGLCQVCLVLATLVAATLPGHGPGPAEPARCAALLASGDCPAATPAGTPYRARAPPALSALS